MQSASNTKMDRTFGVVPEVRPSAPWRVVKVEALPDWALRVTFMDGLSGMVDLKAFLAQERVEGTPFEPLRGEQHFREAGIVLGAVSWPGGADLSPAAMYEGIQAKGVWTPG